LVVVDVAVDAERGDDDQAGEPLQVEGPVGTAGEALQEIEQSLGEIEHAAGLAEESLDLLATTAASLTGLTSLDGGDGWARHTAGSPDPDPAPAPGRAGGPDHG